ncbi:flagellar filament capping protein FliD [Borreliella carolinensis]|uniref:flagellar filament capping protein FliD n=1 Tax=Borreliella carolinensis TaxID=478174 RepID=UPI0029426471|nr:flagellar filament capping protein FliD [Borreliella carolinensis]WNY64715.1 flagellar filament capping protein FliD [Borreliella carolinensis]
MASGFFVPGLESKYNTKEIRESMLKSDKAKIDTSFKKLESLEQEKSAWQLINRKISTLNSLAKEITSLNSPFNLMSGNSSNSEVLTLSTRYGSKNETHKLIVDQIASADVFLSANFDPKKVTIPEGDYIFLVGKKEINVKSNGNIDLLVKDINNKGKGFLSAKIVKSDKNGNSRFVLQSLKEGKENKLVIKGEGLSFAKQIGILSELKTNFNPSLSDIAVNQSSSNNRLAFENNSLVLNPLSEVSIEIPEDIEITSRSKIKFKVKYFDTGLEEPDSKIIFNPGGATFKDAKVDSEDSVVDLGSDLKTPLEKKYIQMNMVKISSKEGSLELPLINISNDFEEVEVDVGALSNLEEINIENKANNKVIVISNVEIFDPKNRDGYLPINAKSFAENAKIKFDGVDVERDSNVINDLVPNVTLSLKKASSDVVEAKVEPDYEEIKRVLLDFIGAYNEVLAEINIVSSNEDQPSNQKSNIVEELTYLSDSQKEEAYKNLGILRSEFLLKNLKSRLESIIFKPYVTSDPNFSIINQMGVFTNSISSSGGLSRYLRLDEKKFDESIRNNIDNVRELFLFDLNGDRVYDNGIAKMLGDCLSPLVASGGVIYNKIKNYDLKIFNQKNKVEDYKKKYEDRERKVEGDLNTLDFTVKRMKDQENTLRAFDFNQRNK